MTPSFPHHMVAAIARTALTLFEHLPPILAATVLFAAVTAVFVSAVAVPWGLCVLAVHTRRLVAKHVADCALRRLNSEYEQLCGTYSLGKSDGAEFLPGVTRIGPATPPLPVRRPSRRSRMPGVRTLRRRPRRTTTSFSSDRRPR